MYVRRHRSCATLPGSGEYANYSALVRANAVSLSIIVMDWANDIVMGPNVGTNPVLYNQVSPYTGHPTVAGAAFLATDGLAVLRPALGK
jgi:hypothetical protein